MNTKKPKLTIPEIELMTSGHFGCPGCGACLAMRYVLKALGTNTTLNIPACCWAVMPGVLPYTCIKVPLLYNAFETTAATACGIRAALDIRGEKNVTVVGFAGDGGTADIGIQALSGAAERGENILYVCYDNEAYMNTGIQRSSATPYGAWTTTTPVGKEKYWQQTQKKNCIEIVAAHKVPYVATACTSFPEDLIKKVEKAKNIVGFRYIHILAPCPVGWRYSPEKTIEIGRLAVNSNAFPLYEIENCVYKITRKPKKKVLIKDYYKLQGRFKHLPSEIIDEIQKQVDYEWLVLNKKEEFSQLKTHGACR